METKEPDFETVTIEDMMRVAGWKQAYNQGQRHFHEQRHTRSIVKWFNSCRFFAPYYTLTRLFKFDGKQWEKAFLILTRNEFFSGSLYVKGSLNRPIDLDKLRYQQAYRASPENSDLIQRLRTAYIHSMNGGN